MNKDVANYQSVNARPFVLDARQHHGRTPALLQPGHPRYEALITEYLASSTLRVKLVETGEPAVLRAGVDFGFVAYYPRLGGVAWGMLCYGCRRRRRALHILRDRAVAQCARCLGLYRRGSRRAALLTRAARRVRELEVLLAAAAGEPEMRV